jgi:hypothetical protein
MDQQAFTKSWQARLRNVKQMGEALGLDRPATNWIGQGDGIMRLEDTGGQLNIKGVHAFTTARVEADDS